MTLSRWSPTDLSRQALVVRRIALRAEVDQRQLRSAWHRCVAQIEGLGAPLGVISCFLAGVVVGSTNAQPQTSASSAGTEPRRRGFSPAFIREFVLSALAYVRWSAAKERSTAAAAPESNSE